MFAQLFLRVFPNFFVVIFLSLLLRIFSLTSVFGIGSFYIL